MIMYILIQNSALVVKVSNLKVSFLLFQTRLTGRVEDLRVVVIDREGSGVTLDISDIVSMSGPSFTRLLCIPTEPYDEEICAQCVRMNKTQYGRLIVFTKYTMQNKFNNYFVWFSQSTLDLTFFFLIERYKHRTPDNDFHVKDCKIFKRNACDNVTLDFEAKVQKGISDYKEKPKLF